MAQLLTEVGEQPVVLKCMMSRLLFWCDSCKTWDDHEENHPDHHRLIQLDHPMIDQEKDAPTGWGIVNNEVCGLSRPSCYTLFSAYLKQLETKLQQNPSFMTTVIKRAVWRCTALYDDQCPDMELDLIQAWANAGTPPEGNKGLAGATLRTYKVGMPRPKHEWAYG